MSRRGIGTGASTGTVRAGVVDGGPSLPSVAGACLVLMGTPLASMLWGPSWLLPAEAVPAGAVVVAAVTAYRAGARRMRADHAAAGFGIDPDASTPDHPWAVTARPGREAELLLDGLAWSRAGCPMPAREVQWCAEGHPATTPAGGLVLGTLRILLDRRRWQCREGHPGVPAVAAPVVPVVPAVPAGPAGPVWSIVSGPVSAAELAADRAAPVPVEVAS